MYDEHDFERLLCMPGDIFERICSAVIGKGIFAHRRDVTKKLDFHSKLCIIAAIQTLAYGMAWDQVDDLCEMKEMSVRITFEAFVTSVAKRLERSICDVLMRRTFVASMPSMQIVDSLDECGPEISNTGTEKTAQSIGWVNILERRRSPQ